jgi:hypothetical protein
VFRRHALFPWLPLIECLTPEGGGGGGGTEASLKDLLKGKRLKDLVKEHPDLQDEIDDAIESRLARDRRNRTDDDGLTGKERKELEELREKQTQLDQAEAERKREYDKALGIEREKWTAKENGYKQKTDTLVGELRSERVRGKLIAAATRAGAVDPEDVASLLESRVELDETFKATVRDARDRSKVAINAKGEDMSVDELVEELLERKPHLAKPAGGAGAGARGSEGGAGGKDKGGDPALADLKQAYEDAQKTAKDAPTPGNLTKMQQAKRRYDDAVAKSKAKAA